MKATSFAALALSFVAVGAAGWCATPGSSTGFRAFPLVAAPSDLPVVAVSTADASYDAFDGVGTNWKTDALATAIFNARKYKDDVSPGGIAASAKRLAELLLSSGAFPAADEALTRVRAQLLDLAHRASLAPPSSLSLIDNRFRVVRWQTPTGDRVSSTWIFSGQDDGFRLRETPMTAGAVPGVLVAGTPVDHYVTVDQAVVIRAVCSVVEDVFAEVRKAPFERVVARLTDINTKWDNYLENGYSQYPWESYLNSAVGEFSWYDPPERQWVLLHPELGGLIDTRSTRGGVDTTLLVHGVGHIWYGGEEREWFAGVSATASFADDDAGMGIGPTLHFGHTKFGDSIPHVSLSVLWHDFETGSSGPVVALSLDLWRLVDSGSGSSFFESLLAQ